MGDGESEHRGGGEECSNSSGVKLLRWKIVDSYDVVVSGSKGYTINYSATPAGVLAACLGAKLLIARLSRGLSSLGELVGNPAPEMAMFQDPC